MNLAKLSQLAATLACGLALACPSIRAAEPASPPPSVVFPGVDVGILAASGEQITTARSNAIGVAVIKIPVAGNYTVVIQPLPKNRTGTYNRGRMNTAAIAINGVVKPVTGSYNFTGADPCRLEIITGPGATVHVKITPPAPPVKADHVKPAMQ